MLPNAWPCAIELQDKMSVLFCGNALGGSYFLNLMMARDSCRDVGG
jgi:hypothetical protein